MAKVKSYLLPKTVAEVRYPKALIIIYLHLECQLWQELNISGRHANAAR